MINNILNKSVSYLAGFADVFDNLTRGISRIKITEIQWEWWLAFFIAFVIFLSGFSYGKTRLFISMLALYAAAFIEPLFVYFEEVAGLIDAEQYIVRIIIFFVIYFIAFGLFNRSSLRTRFTLKEYSLAPITIFAVIKFGFLASIILNYLPPEITAGSLSAITPYFAEDTAFWWAVMPIIGTVFLGRSKNE